MSGYVPGTWSASNYTPELWAKICAPVVSDTDGGEVQDTYGRTTRVVGDRSGAVRLDFGPTDRMLTPEIWDDLDRKVRAAFRPELLAQELADN